MPYRTVFRLLGRVEAERDGQRIELGRRRERCLLAMLLLKPGTVLPVERLLDLLWDDNPTANARVNLHSHVSRLRNALNSEEFQIHARDGGYVAEFDPLAVDAHQFLARVEIGRNTADLAERSRILRQALALWRGPVLADVATDRLRDRVAGDLDALRLTATEILMDDLLSQGRHDEVLGELLTITAEHPLRERPVGQLMLALYRVGRQPDALAVYHRLRTRLAEDLGVDPAPELQDRYAAILRHEPALNYQNPVAQVAVPTQLPPVTARLAGRDPEFARLDGGNAVWIVRGMPGVGKTALAVHWAHAAADRFPDGQLFVDLCGYSPGPAMQPAEVLAQILAALGIEPDRIPSSDPELSALYRTSLTGKKVLVVLDNAASAAQVRPLIPGTDTCVTVITSRDDLGGLVATHDAQLLTLDVLDEPGATRLLTDALGTQADPADISELARLCGYLPLALRIAAAQVINRGQPVTELVSTLAGGKRLAALQIAGDAQSAVRSAMEQSYRTLGPLAQKLFRRLGIVAGPDFTQEVAATLLDLPDADATLAQLVNAHLVAEHQPDRFRMHDLVRDFAIEKGLVVETAQQRRAAIERVLRWYLHTACLADQAFTPFRPRPGAGSQAPTTVPPTQFASHSTALAWCVAEEANLVATVRQAVEYRFDEIAWRIPASLGYFSIVRQRHPQLLECFRLGVAAAERSGNREGSAWMVYGLGVALEQRRLLNDAIVHYGQSVALFKEAGPLWAAAAVLNSLGTATRELGRTAESFDYLAESAELFTELGMPWGVGLVRHSEGDSFRRVGDLEEAIDCYRKSAEIAKDLGSHWGRGVNHVSIGDTYWLLGQTDTAMDNYRQALYFMREAGDRRNQGMVLDLLGGTARDLDDARRYWTEALEIYEELDDPRADELRGRLNVTG